jgi:hypothetical protein
MDVPLSEQLIVAAIRKYRNTPQQRTFWQPVLARIESEIADMLSLINKEIGRAELRDALGEKADRIREIYQTELSRLARQYRKSGAEPLAQLEFHAVDLFTSPRGGEISYMPAGRWELYLFMRDERNHSNYRKPDWITIEQMPVRLGGKNWFRIRWANNVEKKELVNITSSKSITFRPR